MKRIYSNTVKLWLLKAGIPVGTLIGGIFIYLSMIGAITITGHSGDSICAGTIDDPCYAYINLTANEDIFIYPVEYDPYGRNTSFDFEPGVKEWKLERSWGNGWREIPLNKTCTGTWCGAPNNKGVSYSFVFREGRDYQIRIVAYKENPEDTIKWSAFDGKVDPYWFGKEGPTEKYTYNSKTVCNEGKCNRITGLFAFDEGEWKPVSEAKSLRNSSIKCEVNSDGEHIVECKDWNLTSVTLNVHKENNFGETPIRILSKDSEGQSYEKERFIDNFEDNSIKEITIDYNLGDVIHIGENSTTISLQTADTENLDDTYIALGGSSEYGTKTYLYLLDNPNLIYYPVMRWTVPSDIHGTTIDSATINFYVHTNSLDSGEVENVTSWMIAPYPDYHIDGLEWTEGNGNVTAEDGEMNWLEAPTGGNLSNQGEVLQITTGDPATGGFNFNLDVSPTFQQAADDELSNVSFLIKVETVSGSPYIFDYLLLESKEYSGGANDPILNITYTESTGVTYYNTTINSDKIEADIELHESPLFTSEAESIIKFDISDFCSYGSNLNVNTAYIQQRIINKVGSLDSDINVSLITNQTWTEEDNICPGFPSTCNSWVQSLGQNSTLTTMSSTTNNTYTNISIGSILNESCARGEDYMTLKYFDPDKDPESSLYASQDDYSIGMGDFQISTPAYYEFASREHPTYQPMIYVTNFTVDEVSQINISQISPANDTYNDTFVATHPKWGEYNFECQINSTINITEVNFTFDKYYDGPYLTTNNTFGRFYNITTVDVRSYPNRTNFNVNITLNLTNGWYDWKCSASDTVGYENESDNWFFKNGKGDVGLLHHIHTEPSFNGSAAFVYHLNATYLAGNYYMSLNDFTNTSGYVIYDATHSTYYRGNFYDSYGKNQTYTWLYRIDEINCQSNESCDVIIKAMAPFNDKLKEQGDGFGFHFHHLGWYNYPQWESDGDLTAYWGESGSCPAGGCQPGDGWSQLLTANGSVYFNDTFDIITDRDAMDKMLAVYIFGSPNAFPRSFASGWFWEDTPFSNWLELYIPFGFDAWDDALGDGESHYGPGTPGEPFAPGNVYNWSNAPRRGYHPNSTGEYGFKTPGDLNRIEFNCPPLSYDRMNESWALADEGLDTIYCYYDHSYSSPKITVNVGNFHRCINSTKFLGPGFPCSDGTEMEELYPDVNYRYGTDVELMQNMFELEDTTPPTLTMELDGNIVYVNSSENLYKNPALAVKNTTKYNSVVMNKIGDNQYSYDVSDYGNILEMRAAAMDTSYNSNYSEIVSSELNITYPTQSNYINTSYPNNITVNFTVTVAGEYQTTDVVFESADINGTDALNISEAIYIGSNTWQINLSLPCITTDPDYFDLNLTISSPVQLSDFETNAIYINETTVCDTCSCPGSGNNWEVNMEDMCTLTETCDLGIGNLSWTGTSGWFNCSAQLNLNNRDAPLSNTIFYFSDGCEIIRQ